MAWDNFFSPILNFKPREQQIFDQYGMMGPQQDQSTMPQFDNIPQFGMNDIDIPNITADPFIPQGPTVDQPYFDPFNQPDFNTDVESQHALERYMKAMDAYKPHTEAVDRYTQIADRMPIRGTPSILQKIAASAYGFKHGPKGAEEIMSGPYLRRLSDWKSELEPAEKAAEFERSANTNERQLLSQSALNQYRIDQLGIANRKAGETERNNRERTRISEMLARNAGGQFYMQPGGQVWLLHKDGSPAENMKINTGTWTDAQKAQFRAALQRAGISERGAIQMKLEDKRQEGLNKRATEAETGRNTRAAATGAGQTETQQLTGQFRRAQELSNDPNFKDLVSKDQTGNRYTLNTPKTSIFGGPEATAKFQADMKRFNDAKTYIETGKWPVTGGGQQQRPSQQPKPPDASDIRVKPEGGYELQQQRPVSREEVMQHPENYVRLQDAQTGMQFFYPKALALEAVKKSISPQYPEGRWKIIPMPSGLEQPSASSRVK